MRKKRIRHIRVVELAFLPIKNHDTMIPTYVDSIEEKTKRQKMLSIGEKMNLRMFLQIKKLFFHLVQLVHHKSYKHLGLVIQIN